MKLKIEFEIELLPELPIPESDTQAFLEITRIRLIDHINAIPDNLSWFATNNNWVVIDQKIDNIVIKQQKD